MLVTEEDMTHNALALKGGTYFWLGRLTGLGAVTLPKETMRPLGLHRPLPFLNACGPFTAV